MQKVCYYNIQKKKYGWSAPDMDFYYVDNTTCCIMSIAKDKTLYSIDLQDMVSDKIISSKQYNSIKRFDGQKGTIKDLDIIKQLAKKLKIKLKEHKDVKV